MASNKKGNEKNNLEPLKKDGFIKFIASSSPKEINEFISTYGKKPKLMIPIVYF